LDWFDGDPGSNVGLRLLPGGTVKAPVATSALFRFAGAVLVADRAESRDETVDRWTRDIGLSVPAGGAAALGATAPLLGFLTGDRWEIEARVEPIDRVTVRRFSADIACLLSGGLDSLVGALNLLADDDERRVVLVGFDDQEASVNRQRIIFEELRRRYPHRVSWVYGELRSAKEEITTRSRSMVFIALGLLMAAAIGPAVPLYVPENGLIGLNVPLIGTRSGSASTRTTHPHFMAGLNHLLQELRIENPVVNPLRLCTKGEALAQCLDQDALGRLAPVSISCAHLPAVRWVGGELKQCGYCYPCLVRRASMSVVGLDDGDDYKFDVLTEPGFLSATPDRPASLRALLAAVRRGTKPTDALVNGPVPSGEESAFASVYARGIAELETWLRRATAPEVLAWLP
jgi:hypothetical protein